MSLAFATEQLLRKYSNKRIADTDIVLYSALPDPVFLQKLTLQGCPTSDCVAVTAAIREAFKQYGDVACVVPMVHVGTGWCTDTFHLTLRVPSADAPLPPPQLALFDDITITVDAPGRRRFCKFCNSDKHTRYDCRQGQRQRATTKANKQKEAAFLREQAAESSDDDTLADDTSRSEETVQEEVVMEKPTSPRKSPEPRGPAKDKETVDTPMADVSAVVNASVAAYNSAHLGTGLSGNLSGASGWDGNSYAALGHLGSGVADTAFKK